MKFLEAFEYMVDGEFCQTGSGEETLVYRISENSLEIWRPYQKCWKVSGVSFSQHSENNNWEICEDPGKDERPAKLSYHGFGCRPTVEQFRYLGFTSEEGDAHLEKCMEAIKVILRLKAAKGAIGIIADKNTYIIAMAPYTHNIQVLHLSELSYKVFIGAIYFFFETKEAAEAALADIGSDKILNMFNFFRGVSE